MNQLQKGANAPVPTEKLTIKAVHDGANTDLSAIMLNAAGKVRSEADFVFYAQTRSPEGSVNYVEKKVTGSRYEHSMTVDLKAVPADIERIELTLTIDPDTPATFAQVKNCMVSLLDASGKEVSCFAPEGTVENAFIVGELYRRNGVWKVRHVAQGFTGGLGAIATQFGIEIADEAPQKATTPPAAVAPAAAQPSRKISLSKADQVTADLERKGSRLVSLQKAAAVSLKKHKVDGIVARVVMVLDASGSTRRMWPDMMQGVTDRLATLALNLDDNGELEFWVYASSFKKFATVNLGNLDGYVASLMRGEDGSSAGRSAKAPEKKSGGLFGGLFSGGSSLGAGIVPGLGWENNEPPVMQAIMDECKGSKTVPTLVIFVTDGGIDKDRAIEKVLVEASHHNIFWQFVGLGGSSYGVLERFDELSGRHVDNAGFFAIDDYRDIKDEELYSRIIREFPKWVDTVRAKGMLV